MNLSWAALRMLEEEHGDSFYILDIRRFEKNLLEMRQAFRCVYPNTNIGYSCKTNYLPRLCQAVSGMDGYVEVSSAMEYDLATICGVDPRRLIFNGPLKSADELERALIAGSIVNLDGFEEVEIVEALARACPDRSLSVGLRCNFDIGERPISRFGFDVNGGDLETAFSRLDALRTCRVDGLHCHFSTPGRSVKSYRHRTEKLLEVADRHFKDRQPRFIDVGGGFFGKMPTDLRSQFDVHVPTYAEYADAVASPLRRRYPDETGVELIVEPGMAVVSDVLAFVAKVRGVKQIQSRRVALVSGSIHDVRPTMTDKRLALRVYASDVRRTERTVAGPVDLVGYTCLEHDCLYAGYSGEIGVDDYAVFENVGAYTIVLRPPFIRPGPPVVSYDALADAYALVRRRETVEDVLSTYVI